MILSGPRPRLLGDLVQLHDEADPRRSDGTLLAAALLTLGIPPATKEFFHATRQFDRGANVWRTIWSFREESKCRRFGTRTMIDAWSDGAWILQNPKHPLAILRSGLTYPFAFQLTPRFTLAELAKIESPDTWLESAARNLVILLRDMPEALTATRDLIWFAADKAGCVPRCMSEPQKKRLLNYVESNEQKRGQIRLAA